MRPQLMLALFAALLAALAIIPGVPPFWITLLNNIGLAALVSIGLVMLTGVGGMTSFGQAAFVGFGAYTTAVLTTTYGFSPWLSLPVALAVTGIAAVLLGLITVRLSGHYLPLGTLAWGISLYFLFGKIDMLGRHDGISGIPPLAIGPWSLIDPKATYWVIWICVLLVGVGTSNLLSSRVGRAIRALRRGGIAAEAFGVDRMRVKLVVFVYAALLAGLSGWLYAHLQRSVNPTPFGLSPGIEYLLMATIGGAGHVWGGLLGAGVVVILKDALQRILPAALGSDVQAESIVFGIVPSRWGCCHPHPSQTRTCGIPASGSSRKSFARDDVFVNDPGLRQGMAVEILTETGPQEVAPSSPRQPFLPDALDLVEIPSDASAVSGDGVAGVMPPHHPGQVSILSDDRDASVFSAPLRHGRECPGVSILRRHLPHHVLAVPRRSPHVGEAEEVERGPVRRRMAFAVRPLEPEVHEPRLVRKKAQPEPVETFAEDVEHTLGGEVILERHHGVVSVTYQNASPLQTRSHHGLKPFIQHVVKINVREQWRDYAALRGSFGCAAGRAVFQHARLQPRFARATLGRVV